RHWNRPLDAGRSYGSLSVLGRLPPYHLTCEGRARAPSVAPEGSNCPGLAASARCTAPFLSGAAAGRCRGGWPARPSGYPMILTTHTGSLPRPTDLSEMMLQFDAGQLADVDVLRGRIASATAEVVRRQAEIGIDVLNDGEYGKASYAG